MIAAWFRRRKLAKLAKAAEEAWLEVGRNPSLRNLARMSRADMAYNKAKWGL